MKKQLIKTYEDKMKTDSDDEKERHKRNEEEGKKVKKEKKEEVFVKLSQNLLNPPNPVLKRPLSNPSMNVQREEEKERKSKNVSPPPPSLDSPQLRRRRFSNEGFFVLDSSYDGERQRKKQRKKE